MEGGTSKQAEGKDVDKGVDERKGLLYIRCWLLKGEQASKQEGGKDVDATRLVAVFLTVLLY